MAFCNSCGAALTPDTNFCNKCGAAVAAGPATPGAALSPLPPAPPASTGGTSALKIILIVIAIIIGLGILSVGAFSFFVYRVAKSARVSQDGQHVKVETPFGNMETSKDPEQAAKDLGVDIYPGAQAQKTGNASMTFGNMHTVTASFQSSDSADKICDFYKTRLPNATSTSNQNHCSVISNDKQNSNMITINVQSDGDTSKIQIASVTKKASD
jgi:hypothetical protein